MLLEELANLIGFHITENGNHAVAGGGEVFVKFFELFLGNGIDRIGRAQVAKPIGMGSKEVFANEIAGDGCHLFFVGFDSSHLAFLFEFDLALWEKGIEKDIRKKLYS